MLKYDLSDESKKMLDDWKLEGFVNKSRFADEQVLRLGTISDTTKALTKLILTSIPACKGRDIVLQQCKSIVFLCGSALLSSEGNIKKDKVG